MTFFLIKLPATTGHQRAMNAQPAVFKAFNEVIMPIKAIKIKQSAIEFENQQI